MSGAAYQPLLFPDEVWEVWCEGRDEFRRASKQIRGHGHDRPLPGWPSGARGVGEKRSFGTGIAGTLHTELN